MSPRVKLNNYDFQGKMHYLILLTLWFHQIFKLIFFKQSSWPKGMYAEHWRKLAWATFLGNFSILLVQQFCGALMNSCWLGYATVYPIKNKFYVLKWNRFFSTFIPVLSESRQYFKYLWLKEVCTHLQIERSPLMKFW